MNNTKTKIKTCLDYKVDLSILAATGRINDNYIEHLNICEPCQKEMQAITLNNIKALTPDKRI
jgi:hypothetical protein